MSKQLNVSFRYIENDFLPEVDLVRLKDIYIEQCRKLFNITIVPVTESKSLEIVFSNTKFNNLKEDIKQTPTENFLPELGNSELIQAKDIKESFLLLNNTHHYCLGFSSGISLKVKRKIWIYTYNLIRSIKNQKNEKVKNYYEYNLFNALLFNMLHETGHALGLHHSVGNTPNLMSTTNQSFQTTVLQKNIIDKKWFENNN